MANEERQRVVRKTAERALWDLEKLKGYSRLQHIMKCVTLVDDTRLSALDFALDLTPEISEDEA